MPSELTQIKTKDGLWLEGLLFESKHKTLRRGSGRAIALWISGLTGRFSGNPKRIHAIAGELARKNISFGIFNNRGFGNINSLKIRGAYKYFGTTFEKFEDSVLDIEAMIRFCKKRGYKNIFLFGHSTGANKSAYYILKKRGRGLAGIGLIGPMSDIPGIKKNLGKKYKKTLEIAEKMVKRGKGNELLPLKMTYGLFYTAARFWSIAREGSNEDTFPYYGSTSLTTYGSTSFDNTQDKPLTTGNLKHKFRWAKKVRLPILVLIGGKEEYADRPVPEIMEIFRKQINQKYFSGKIIKGANHSFKKKEKELGQKMAEWISAVSK